MKNFPGHCFNNTGLVEEFSSHNQPFFFCGQLESYSEAPIHSFVHSFIHSASICGVPIEYTEYPVPTSVDSNVNKTDRQPPLGVLCSSGRDILQKNKCHVNKEGNKVT